LGHPPFEIHNAHTASFYLDFQKLAELANQTILFLLN